LPVLLLSVLAAGQDFAGFRERVSEFTLDNGFHFVVFERHEAPVVSFHTYVGAGFAFGPPGLAQLFQRLAFKGTEEIGTVGWAAEKNALEKVEEAYDRLEKERAARTGQHSGVSIHGPQLNIAIQRADAYVVPNAAPALLERNGAAAFRAATGADAIEYSYRLPSNRAELWFLLESERFRSPMFREFYKERDALIEELRARDKTNSQARLLEAVLATAFAGRPYGKGAAGSLDLVANLRARDAARFFKTYFAPSNVTFAIAGDMNPEQAKRLAQQYFGGIPAGAAPTAAAALETAEREPRQVARVEGDPLLCVAYRRPGGDDRDDPVFDVIWAMMSPGGILEDELVRGRRIAVAASARPSLPGAKFENLFAFIVTPTLASTLEENEQALDEILETLRSAPPDERQLTRAKAALHTGLLRRMASNDSLAALLAAARSQYGDWRKLPAALRDVRRVQVADVQRVARLYFTPERRTTGYSRRAEPAGERQ
jgi:predicted Zn-dependent peptidase